jgi:hypothetical protein
MDIYAVSSAIFTGIQLDDDANKVLGELFPNYKITPRYFVDTSNLTLYLNSISSIQSYDQIAYESIFPYSFPCGEQLFQTLLVKSSLLISHSLFHCCHCDLKSTFTDYQSDIPNKRVVSLSPCINQYVSAIKSFLINYEFTTYAIIYADVCTSTTKHIDYYRNFAFNLIMTLSVDSFRLDFSMQYSSPLLIEKLKNSTTKGKLN